MGEVLQLSVFLWIVGEFLAWSRFVVAIRRQFRFPFTSCLPRANSVIVGGTHIFDANFV
jgi:hypothetical protein